MNTNHILTPAFAIHPGEMLKDELDARNITQKEFAKKIGVSYTMLNDIINGRRNISAEMAVLFEAALGTEAGVWVELQAQYDLMTVRSDSKLRIRFDEIRKVCAALL